MNNISEAPDQTLTKNSEPFMAFLQDWLAHLPRMAMKNAILHPDRTAILSVDMTEGFCRIGPLSSLRVKGIIKPITNLVSAAWKAGVRDIILVQDSHEEEAMEFSAWPAHCVRGTPEAETVWEFKELPFFDQILILEKNSISSGLTIGLNQWMASHPQMDTFIVVGDCTDLCTYQLAMHLRLEANDRQLNRRVIVPADCVQTYDLPVETAQKIGTLPHDGDFLHAVFLYHMQLNGIEVVQEII
jgi:nicotinamidase-related amidase